MMKNGLIGLLEHKVQTLVALALGRKDVTKLHQARSLVNRWVGTMQPTDPTLQAAVRHLHARIDSGYHKLPGGKSYVQGSRHDAALQPSTSLTPKEKGL